MNEDNNITFYWTNFNSIMQYCLNKTMIKTTVNWLKLDFIIESIMITLVIALAIIILIMVRSVLHIK